MRKRSKLLAIALLTIIVACSSIIGSIFAFANTVVPDSNLTAWGDAESGDSQGLTAVTTEKFEGEKSFEFSGSKKIRIKILSDGTLYQVSLKVKGAAEGTTFSLKAIGTHKDVDGKYAYTNHGGTSVTLTEEWTDYTFCLAYRYDATEQIVYYSNDGINESKKENIASCLLGFDLQFDASDTIYMDNIAVEKIAIEEEEEEVEELPTDAIFATGFENGADGFGVDGTGFNCGVIVNKTDDANGVYSGNQALKVVKGYSRNKSVSGDWITKGDFFTFKAYAKLAGDTAAKAKVQLKIWEMANGAQAALSDLIVVPQQSITGTEWVELTYTVGLYAADGKVYAYHNGGSLDVIKESGNESIKATTYLDIITTGGSVYFDNVSIVNASVAKDATVTVVDANGAPVSGASLIVKDAEGNVLDAQPEITESEGVYTIKGLAYSNFAQSYTVCIGENTCAVDFINAEGEIALPADEGGEEGGEEEELPTDAIFATGFENGADGFGVDGTGFNCGVIVNKTDDANGVYSGNQALKVVKGYSRNKSVSGDWITKGDFFTFKAYAKLAGDTEAKAKVNLKIWEMANGAQAALSDLIVVPQQSITGTEWVELTYTVGLYAADGKVYAYHNGGSLDVIKESGNESIKATTYLDIITTGGSVYFDNVSIVNASVAKDATVTVVDANGAPVSGASLIVKDADGNVLDAQPEITESEGVYTIKGLAYSNFAQSYTVCIGENTCAVDFINAEGEIALPADEGGEEGGEDEGTKVEIVPGSNLTTWGDAEAGDSQGFTAVDTEKYEGEKSFEFKGSKTIKVNNVVFDGTLYQVSLKVKAAAKDTTFMLYAIATHKDAKENYVYTTHQKTEVTLTEEWTEYVFYVANHYEAGEKTVYYSNDGKTEYTLEGVEKAFLNFQMIFSASATVYMDNIAFEKVKVPGEQAVIGDVLYENGFEDDTHGFGVNGSGYESGVIVNKAEDANVYEGSYALKLSGYSRNYAIISDASWIANGDFFVFKAYAKLGEGESTSALAQLILWSVDANGAGWTQDVSLTIMPSTAISGSEWVELSYVFGVYGNGESVYAYHNNGVTEQLKTANNYIGPQAYFDLVSQNGTLYFDNLLIAKTTVKKNAVISIFDMAGNPVNGAELVVKDAEGNVLEEQPQITEKDGVYTIKGLEYSNFGQKYTICYDTYSYIVDFTNSEGEIELDATDDEENLGDPIFSTGFEDGLNGFAGEEGGSGSCVLDSENAYAGENSLKVNGIWTRKEFNDGWIQGGNFFKFSAWVKIASGNPQASAQMYIWGAKDENNWVMCSTRICALTYTTITNDWTYVSGIFGVYSDGTTAYAYHNNGVLEELSDLAGYNIAYKVVFDLGATVGGSIYYDEISIVPVKAYQNATVTVYGAENPELVVCDENGVALENQPKIVENEGVYTIRALGFEGFAHKYIVKVYDNGEEYGSQEISFVNNSVIIASPFDGTVTVTDVDGNPVTNATITYGDVTVTENVNGVYTLAGLITTTEITVICEGLLPGYVVITPDERDASVVVKAERPVVDVDGNKIFDGNFENGFAHNLMKQKADAVITNVDQYSGKKSWKITGNDVSARILARTAGIDVNGTEYYFEVMAKSTNNAIFSIGGLFTGYDADGQYCYPTVMSDIVLLTDEWQRISITFSFRHDAVTNKMYISINGEEEVEFTKSFASMAAFDMVFSVSDGGIAYVDDIVLLETYTGSVTVMGEDGNLLEGATFVLTDFAGNTLDIEPEFNVETKEYVFENLAGNVTVVATAGGKTYSAVTLTKSFNSIQIETSYTITLTLKDQYDQPVIGAIVYARKLLTTVGTFVDNGDGTYTLEEAMGTVTIVVVADGYSFTRLDGVTSDNADVTMIGENFNGPDVNDSSNSSDTSISDSGCFASASSMAMIAIPAMLAVSVILKKKED